MADKNVSPESETNAVSRNDLDGTYAIGVDAERRYHGVKNVDYPLPNDDEEHKRLEDVQLVFRTLVGGNVIAPISEHPTQILDVGTGGGAWVVEVAKEYPEAQIFGLDISPISRLDAPNNCKFIQGDLNEGLKFEDKSTDLVHSRAIMASQTKEQWPGYMKEVYRILKHDGWIQCVEFQPFYKCDDGTVPEDAALWKFQKYIRDLFENEKGFLLHGEHLEENIKAAGFVDVKARAVRIDFRELTADPNIGPRPVYNSFAGVVGPLTGCMAPIMPDEKARTEYAKQIMAEMTNSNHTLYTTAYVVIGRKPDTPEDQGKE